MEFVVSEQLHATREILLQNFQIEARACGFGSCDIVERLLKGEPIECLGAVGEQAFENIGNAIFPRRCLKLGLLLDRSMRVTVGLVFSV